MEFKHFALHNNINVKSKIKSEDGYLSAHGLKVNLQVLKRYFK